MRIIVSIIFMVLWVGAHAQESISFEDAMAMVAENSRVINSARCSVDAAYMEYRAAHGLRAPQVDITGGYTIMQHDVDIDLGGAKGVVTNSLEQLVSKGVDGGVISPSIASLLREGLMPLKDAEWSYTLQKRDFGFVGTTITMPIYLGGRINIANRVASLGVESANNSLVSVENSLITELVERYFGVILAREVVKVRAMVVEGVEQHLSDALAMEEEGVLAHSAILYLKYKLSEAERDYGDAVGRLQVAEIALETTLNTTNSISPADGMFITTTIPNVEYFKECAEWQNPIIRQAQLARSLTMEGIEEAKSQLLPQIVAIGAASIYNYNLSDIVPRWSMGVGVTIPLFGGFSRQHQLRVAQSKSQSAVEMTEELMEDISLLVDKEYHTLCNALLNVQSCERSISFAESYYYTILEGFREGITTSTELMDARTMLAGAQVEYLDAVYRHMLSLARLLELSGLSNDFVRYASSSEVVNINSVIL